MDAGSSDRVLADALAAQHEVVVISRHERDLRRDAGEDAAWPHEAIPHARAAITAIVRRDTGGRAAVQVLSEAQNHLVHLGIRDT